MNVPVLVHHRASLGDTILLWPMLRAMVAEHPGAGLVRFASDAGKARLAGRRVGVTPVDAETRGFSRLWSDRAEVVDADVRAVVYVGGPEDAEDARRLRANLGMAFPGAEASVFPGRADRVRVRAWARELGLTPIDPPAMAHPAGPVVLHVGSGSREKCWAMERWVDLAARLTRRGRRVSLIAGEAEADRHSAEDRRMFVRSGGSYLRELSALESALEGAGLVAACDTGPAHLAGQMGLDTLVFFGPTDPERWAPAGPRVRVLAPREPTEMAWLSVDAAESAIG